MAGWPSWLKRPLGHSLNCRRTDKVREQMVYDTSDHWFCLQVQVFCGAYWSDAKISSQYLIFFGFLSNKHLLGLTYIFSCMSIHSDSRRRKKEMNIEDLYLINTWLIWAKLRGKSCLHTGVPGPGQNLTTCIPFYNQDSRFIKFLDNTKL